LAAFGNRERLPYNLNL